jgi:hypothetical protein
MELRAMFIRPPAKSHFFGFDALDERRSVIVSLTQPGKNLTAAEVRQLSRALFEDETVSRDEACALFELDRAQDACCPEWTEFFVGCLTDHIVWQTSPTGIANAEQTDWLLREMEDAPSLAAFALLANVLAEADRSPNALIDAVRARLKTPAVRAALALADKSPLRAKG